ncbi:sulfur carrier protein/hypothetical protein [Comamonas sp. BIGb0124]|uniref:RnfH family protein n=1 Tax=Comamonas sp. BIGb0124 TaxID=2485130 RepID=UPI000F49017A|nr:RnfH family protein [Comamonas sp. BIGb0124]ROR24752.1 sulfur carrier protein/hypothetical protein [Comamonas sp. BIGb0124]
MRVQLVYAGAQRQVLEVQLDLAAEVSIEQALPDVADVLGEDVVAQIRDGGLEAGVWGERVALARVLRDGDRLEFYRALRVDPKVARRERFSRQGARATGLFAQRRPGSKSGY